MYDTKSSRYSGRLGLVWYGIVVLDDMALLNIALYCSKVERRVSGGVGGWVGWWCAKSFSCQTQLTLHCFGLLVELCF